MTEKNNSCEIPQHVIEELARCFLPDIIAFYEVEENRREYEEWLKQRNAENNKT